MKKITAKSDLSKYTVEELLTNAPKIKGYVFAVMQTPDRKGNPVEGAYSACYFSDMDGRTKCFAHRDTPSEAITAVIAALFESRKK